MREKFYANSIATCDPMFPFFCVVWENWGNWQHAKPRLCEEIHFGLLLWRATEPPVWLVSNLFMSDISIHSDKSRTVTKEIHTTEIACWLFHVKVLFTAFVWKTLMLMLFWIWKDIYRQIVHILKIHPAQFILTLIRDLITYFHLLEWQGCFLFGQAMG